MRETLPPIPADLKVCFDSIVPAPKGALNKSEVIELIASLKLSEADKTACGKRLIVFYESFL